MLTSTANFLNDAAGLEKTLRLIQSFAQIAIALSVTASEAAPWLQARSHIVVARRFFRMPKWVDAWLLALSQFNGGGISNIRVMLAVCKWSCLGMYMFLEMFTITDAMKITNTSWGPAVLRESLKFWFHALSASILLSLYDLFVLWNAVHPTVKTNLARNEKAVEGKVVAKQPSTQPRSAHSVQSKQLWKKLIIDGCDILIPGSSVGWIAVNPVVVGVTGCISSLISMGDIWTRVQGAKASAS